MTPHLHPCEISKSFQWREILPVFQVVCSLIMTIYTVTIYEWFYLEKYTNHMPSFFKASLFCFIRGIEILLFVTILQVRIIPKNPKIEGMIYTRVRHSAYFRFFFSMRVRVAR